jgi:AGZA family xanthine/uracil permease-like MFS transporter
MSKFLGKAFGFDAEKHNVRTEIVAGITTFLTMAYILAVNPSIFSALDMPKGADADAKIGQLKEQLVN